MATGTQLAGSGRPISGNYGNECRKLQGERFCWLALYCPIIYSCVYLFSGDYVLAVFACEARNGCPSRAAAALALAL